MAVTVKTHGMNYFMCAAGDTKPTAASHGAKIGDSLFEYDTFLMYTTYDGTNWVVKNKVVLTTETGDSITNDTLDAMNVAVVDSGEFITQTKTLVGGANSAFDVLSESISAGADWDFAFTGAGEIDDAVLVIATTALTAETSLHLYSAAPTCVLDDNVANTSPKATEAATFLGAIEFAALRDYGTAGMSYVHVSKSTAGGLSIKHSGAVYGVLISVDAMTPGNVVATLILHSSL